MTEKIKLMTCLSSLIITAANVLQLALSGKPFTLAYHDIRRQISAVHYRSFLFLPYNLLRNSKS